MSKRADRAEREQRLAELSELLAARVPRRSVVALAQRKWSLGERAAQSYVAEALARLREASAFDYEQELGLALAGYELIMRKQLSCGDTRAARATLDKLVALLGLARPARSRPLGLAAVAAEIERLEEALEELEGRAL